MLRDSQDYDLGPVISHFFNCFFGNVLPPSEKGAIDNSQPRSQKKVQEDSRPLSFILFDHHANEFIYVPYFPYNRACL